MQKKSIKKNRKMEIEINEAVKSLMIDLVNENGNLKKNIDGLNSANRRLECENRRLVKVVEMQKSLLAHGFIYVNFHSRDCDGVEMTAAYKFKSIEEFETEEKMTGESADGPFSFHVVSKSEWWNQDDCGTRGQGWGIN